MTVAMPTGWYAIESELISAVGIGKKHLKRVEVSSTTSQIAVYFDGFTSDEAELVGGAANLRRCATLPIHQKMYVDELQPALVTVSDYYSPARKGETTYLPDKCQLHWQPPVEVEEESEQLSTTEAPQPTTPRPRTCPICDWSPKTNSSLATVLKERLCNFRGSAYRFEPRSRHVSVEGILIEGTFRTALGATKLASWSANLSVIRDCDCSLLDGVKPVILLPPRWGVRLGDPIVKADAATVLEPNSLWPAIREVLKLKNPNMFPQDIALPPGATGCPRGEGFQRLLKSRLPFGSS